MTILDRIVETTREETARRKQRIRPSDLTSYPAWNTPRRPLDAALRGGPGQVRILAEIKKASPSKGLIRADFDPTDIALRYRDAGAAAISVLTEPHYFQGHPEYLTRVSRVVDIPLLRKDFITDPYQIAEARAWGADAVLLIATVLERSQLVELLHATAEAGLQALVEAYGREDWDRIPFDQVQVAGVNNRDLRTFETDVHRGVALLATAPEGVVKVSESALSTTADLRHLADNGIHAALIGEHFMRQPDPGAALRTLQETFKETEHDRF